MNNQEAVQILHAIRLRVLLVDQALDKATLKEKNMPLNPQIAALITDLDNATNAIAARIQKFIDDANSAGTVSAAEVVAALQPDVDRLKVMGSDPANPVVQP